MLNSIGRYRLTYNAEVHNAWNFPKNNTPRAPHSKHRAFLQHSWHSQVNNDLETPSADTAALVAEFVGRFEDNIALYLRSDMPMGTCLSVGSSAIVHDQPGAASRKHLARQLATYFQRLL